MHDPLAANLSPEPLLATAERYRGTMIDVEQGVVVGRDRFRYGREQLVRGLVSRGLAAGDRALLAVSNGPAFVASLLAILECGGSPLMVHAKTPPAELGRTAERFCADFILCDACQPTALDGVANKVQMVGDGWATLQGGRRRSPAM